MTTKKPVLIKFRKDSLGLIPNLEHKSIPSGTGCQEASYLSGNRYIACADRAVAIVNNGDQRPYFMCKHCALHNMRNRGAKLLFPIRLD